MLIDGISRRGLQERLIEALKGRTMAGTRVFEPAPWPTTPDLFPMILAQVPSEVKRSLYPGLLEFNTTMTLVVIGRLMADTPEKANADLDQISEEIEGAIMLLPNFADAVQQFASISTQSVVNSDGRNHIGEVALTVEVVVYQAYGDAGVPLISAQSILSIKPNPAAAPTSVPVTIIDLQEHT